MYEYVGPNDRWLIDGDCTQCRRAKHCSKPCRLHKQRSQRILTQAVLSAMPPTFQTALEKVLQ